MESQLNAAFQVEPRHFQRPWGGQRLAKGSRPAGDPIGESWVVHEDNLVVSGAHKGKSVAQLAQELGAAFLGTDVLGRRFPVLLKLLDPARWLSVQVHPNDEQARRLVGPEELGKTEAWHIVEAEPGAELILGLKEGTTHAQLAAAMASPAIEQLLLRHPVNAGDTFYVPAGTLHAIGPGMLVVELQQTSDTTFRAYDWGSGRELHLKNTLEVASPQNRGVRTPLPPSGQGTLLQSDRFKLELLSSNADPVLLDSAGKSFHLITVIEGSARMAGAGWALQLSRLETAVVPANAGPYTLQPLKTFRALKSSV